MKTSAPPNVLAFIVLCLFYGHSATQDDGWQLKKETDGLKVYLRDAPHSDIKEVKIETIFDASMATVVSVLKDVPAYSQWVYKCTTAYRLKPSAANSSLYYCRLDFPWPLSDRDFIAQSHSHEDPATGRVFIEVKGLARYKEPTEGIVRIPDLSIHYELIPLPEKKVMMKYKLHSDPGGALPAWLVNLAIDNGPTNTVRGMREMMKNGKYR